MEDQTHPGKGLSISHGVEPNRIAKHALPAAYQRIVPIRRRILAQPKTRPDTYLSNHLPRRVAGE